MDLFRRPGVDVERVDRWHAIRLLGQEPPTRQVRYGNSSVTPLVRDPSDRAAKTRIPKSSQSTLVARIPRRRFPDRDEPSVQRADRSEVVDWDMLCSLLPPLYLRAPGPNAAACRGDAEGSPA